MSIKTNKTICMVFAVTNLGLFTYNHLPSNLVIGLAMLGWVIFLDFKGY